MIIAIEDKRIKTISVITKWIFVLSLSILLITASLGWAVNSFWLYNSGFGRYDISKVTGLNEAELEIVTTKIINYFNSDEEYINLTLVKNDEPFELFNQKEIIHFRDVKELIWLDYWILIGTLIYTLGYTGINLFHRERKYRRCLARGLVGGSAVTLVLILALVLAILLNFDQLFLRFHLISFANEFWSAEGYMLLLFPQSFWYDTALICSSITTMLAVILGVIGGGYLLITRKMTKYQKARISQN